MRTIIELPDDQLRDLKEYCARERISRAEAIRRAVAEMVENAKKDRERKREIFEAAIGIWPDRQDAREIVDELRSEWDHRP